MPLRPRLLHATLAGFVAAGLASSAHAAPSAAELDALAEQVRAAETAFAKTMADRDLAAFTGFVAEDAVFRGATLRIGRAQIVDGWKHYFDKPVPPFSWAPDLVTVAADGRSAVSTGLARTPDGQAVSRFTTIWRKDADGRWRALVDQGVDVDCAAPAGKK